MPKSAQPSIDACQAAICHHPHLSWSACFTLPTDQFNATFQPPLAERITVVPFIRYDADRILPRPTTTFLDTAIFSIVASSSFISLG